MNLLIFNRFFKTQFNNKSIECYYAVQFRHNVGLGLRGGEYNEVGDAYGRGTGIGGHMGGEVADEGSGKME